MRFIGVDPGETVGVAVLDLTEDGVASCFNAFEAPADEALTHLTTFITRGAVIGVERYTIGRDTHKKSQQPRALEVIGTVRRLAREAGAHVRLAPPGPAKRMGNPARLRSLDLWTRGSQGHVNDAASHCVLVLATTDPILFQKFLTSGTVDSSNATRTETED